MCANQCPLPPGDVACPKSGCAFACISRTNPTIQACCIHSRYTRSLPSAGPPSPLALRGLAEMSVQTHSAGLSADVAIPMWHADAAFGTEPSFQNKRTQQSPFTNTQHVVQITTHAARGGGVLICLASVVVATRHCSLLSQTVQAIRCSTQ